MVRFRRSGTPDRHWLESPCIRTALALALSCKSNPFGALHSLLGTLYALWFSLFLQPLWWKKKNPMGSFYYKTQKSYKSSRETNSKSSIPEPKKTFERNEWMNALKRTLDTILQSMVWLWYISVLHGGDMFEKHVHNISGNPGSFVLQLLDLGISLLL